MPDFTPQMAQVFVAILMALTGAGGLVAWRNSTVDSRKSVMEQMGDLNDRLNTEVARLERKLNEQEQEATQRERDLQQQLADMRLAASQREQQLQEQITAVQRQANEREQALQTEIAKLHKRIAEYTEEIDVLRKQLQQHPGGA